MNILRHKKWHVRTKENVARVRRDEAKAAEEEKARAARAALAENEDRVRRLKTRAQQPPGGMEDIFGRTLAAEDGTSCSMPQQSGHVNLFSELEEQERKNLTVGNKEYEAEKKKEQDDWESKVGIMKRFAEDSKEYAKASEWWEGIPLVREKVEKPKEEQSQSAVKFLTKEEKKAMKKEKKRKKERRKRNRSGRNSSSSTDSEEERKKNARLEELRKERFVRERQEQIRAKQLLQPPKKEPTEEVVKSQADMDRQRKYNSQFNPEFSRS